VGLRTHRHARPAEEDNRAIRHPADWLVRYISTVFKKTHAASEPIESPIHATRGPTEAKRHSYENRETAFGRWKIHPRSQSRRCRWGNEWLFLGRGLERETQHADGIASAQFMDENQLRGMWRHYANLMSA
jgi:hypothetical protein